MCISRPAGTLGVLTPQEMAHCIRKVRAAADETYTEARQRARRFVSSSATKSMQGGYSSESSVDADWRGRIDMWRPSARPVELAGQFPASSGGCSAALGAANVMRQEGPQETVPTSSKVATRAGSTPLMMVVEVVHAAL